MDIKKPEPEYNVTTGKKGVIPVDVYGYPRPIIKWQKKVEGSYKTLVKLSDSRLSGPEAETGRMKIDFATGHLIIENVMESDTGDYRIYVEGEDFFVKKSTRVVAKGLLLFCLLSCCILLICILFVSHCQKCQMLCTNISKGQIYVQSCFKRFFFLRLLSPSNQ